MVRFSKAYWLIIGLMAATFAATLWLRAPKTPGGEAVDLARFPKQFADWSAQEDSLDPKVEQVLGTDQVLLRHYRDANGKRVELFIGYFRDQKFGAQVHSPLHCLPGSGWTIRHHGKIPLPMISTAGQANQLYIEKNDENLLVVYWFASGGSVVENEFDLKWRLLLNAFRHQPTSVYFYRLTTPFPGDDETAALQSIQGFLRMAGPFLHGIS